MAGLWAVNKRGSDMEDEKDMPVGDGVACAKCNEVYEEIMNSFRVAIEEMKNIAAKGKGQAFESENNIMYNRYFGCALALDTLLTNYFADRLPKKEVAEEMATEGDHK